MLLALVVSVAPGLSEAGNDGCDVLNSFYWQAKVINFRQNPTNGKIMLLGDSITAGYPDELLTEEYVNRGIAGDTSCGVFYQLGLHVIQENPSVIIIAVGVNDALGGTDFTLFSIIWNNMLTWIKQKMPNTTVYVRSILPVTWPTGTWYTNRTIDTYNYFIKQAADTHGATYLNTNPYFMCSGYIMCPRYAVDGLHLSPTGYQLYSDHFYDE